MDQLSESDLNEFSLRNVIRYKDKKTTTFTFWTEKYTLSFIVDENKELKISTILRVITDTLMTQVSTLDRRIARTYFQYLLKKERIRLTVNYKINYKDFL